MSLRYSCAMIGRHPRSLLTSSSSSSFSQTPSLRIATLQPAQSISDSHHRSRQTRFSSSSSSSSTSSPNYTTLTPPWRFEDLTSRERRAFERWGPTYWQHMAPEQQELAQKMAEKRAQTAVELEKEFGSDWYAIMREATAIKDEQELAELQEELNDDKQYRKKDLKAKKALRRQFFDEKKATKAERLRETMREVARNRPRF